MVLVKFVLDVKNGLAISLKELAIILEPKKRIGNKTSQDSVLVIVLNLEIPFFMLKSTKKHPNFILPFLN